MILHNKKMHKNYVFRKDKKSLYNKYSNFLSTLDIKNETKEWRLKHIRGFLDYITKKNITIKNVVPNTVYDYILSINNLSLRTIENRRLCIRLFFNWLYDNKYNKFSGKLIFPEIVRDRNYNILSYYNKDEISTLINSVDNTTLSGKRDLVILLLFSFLGIRLGDLKKIKVNDIDFKNNSIYIIQQKTDNIMVLPLLKDIRYAIIDYLKSKNKTYEYLITDEEGNPYDSDNIYYILKKQFKISGIEIGERKIGPHSLRHSLATSLINNNIGIYDVSKILGHNIVDSTKSYIKINLKHLRNFSLEVPQWKN